MRAGAAYQTLQFDLAQAQAAERAKAMEVARAERNELLAFRGEASQQVDAAVADAEAAVVNLMEQSQKVSQLDPDQVADNVTAEAQGTPTGPKEPAKPQKICVVIGEMVMDASMSYNMIFNLIQAQFHTCNTSARSVSSVAARLRKSGVAVPIRRQGKADEVAR